MNWKYPSALALMLLALAAQADERLSVCFNYGCLSQDVAVFSEAQLAEVGSQLAAAGDAAGERAAIGAVVGRLLGWAGEQTPIGADRGGNFADAGVYGKMDCIDHATTTTRLLEMLERRGMLRYHRVLEPQARRRFVFAVHFSALIEETAARGAAAGDAGEAGEAADDARYAVDSWFFDNGRPAVVMPLAQWRAGEAPDGVR